MKFYKSITLSLLMFTLFLLPSSIYSQGNCINTSCNCEIVLKVTNNSGVPFELLFGGPGPGFCQTITAEGTYEFTVDGDNAQYFLQLINNATGDDVTIQVEGCNLSEVINLGSGNPIIGGFVTNAPCTIGCSTTECTCEASLIVINNSGVPFELLFGGPGPGFCTTITEEGTYDFILDGDNVQYLMQLINNATGDDVTVIVDGCNLSEVINLGSGNPVIGGFVTDASCTVGCSTTECTCELTLDVFNISGVPFELAFGGPGPGVCQTITAAGQYTFTVDADNATHIMQIINNATNVNLQVLVTGCGIQQVFNLGSGNPVFAIFQTNDPCVDVECITIDHCEGAIIEYCDDGSGSVTITDPNVDYVKVFVDSWSNDIRICSDPAYGDPAPPCVGTIPFQLPAGSVAIAFEVHYYEGENCYKKVPEEFGKDKGGSKGYQADNGMPTLQLSKSKSTDSKEIGVYPNPTNGIVNLKNPEGIRYQVDIINLSGTSVINSQLDSNSTTTIPVDNLGDGIYYIRFTDPNTKLSKMQKLIIIN